MPLSQLAVFVAEIEPLEAAESLRLLNALRLAQAGKDDSDARLAIIAWENQARRLGKVEQPEEKKPTRAEYFAMLRASGIKVV